MKRVLMILAICLAFILNGCESNSYVEAAEEIPNRFEMTYAQSITDGSVVTIIKDTETGVEYLWVRGYNKGGVTVMPSQD